MGTVRAPTDAHLAQLAGRWRILRLEQLYAAGLTRKAVRHRVAQGRLQRLWPGVYLVGPEAPHPLSLAHGATLSFSAAAYASHGWCTFAHGFGPAPELPVDVMVVDGSRFARKGIRTHRSTTLEPRDLGTLHGIRVTSAARAILDCADRLTLNQLEALVADAHATNAVTEAQLADVLNRAGRRKAAAKLRAVLADTNGLTLLIVELDSWAHHGHRKAFNHDRGRNAELTAKGWSVLPVTPQQLRDEPLKVLARVAEALAVRAAA